MTRIENEHWNDLWSGRTVKDTVTALPSPEAFSEGPRHCGHNPAACPEGFKMLYQQATGYMWQCIPDTCDLSRNREEAIRGAEICIRRHKEQGVAEYKARLARALRKWAILLPHPSAGAVLDLAGLIERGGL